MPEGLGGAVAGIAVLVVIAAIGAIILHNPIAVAIAVAFLIALIFFVRSRRRARNRV